MRVRALAASIQSSVFLAVWLGSGGVGWRGILFAALTSLWVMAESTTQARFAASPLRRDAGSPQALVFGALLLATLLLACIGPLQVTPQPAASIFLAVGGTVLAAAGVALRCRAIADLGPFFHNDSQLSASQHRITAGIYAHLRHPSELGTIAFALGAAAVAASPAAAVAAVAVLTPLALHRTTIENRLLESLPPNTQPTT